MAEIIAVCSSEKKGQRKKQMERGLLVRDRGLQGDAHGGGGRRQVSLLAVESVDRMRAAGLDLQPGDFAENLATRGLELFSLPLGTRLKVGERAILRVTQIGKECHDRCAIYEQAGDCVMPREGIFAEVLQGGEVAAGDSLVLKPSYRFALLTASDKGWRGEREDRSGPLAGEMLLPWGDVLKSEIVPDEKDSIVKSLCQLAESPVDAIFTSGGTGLGPRDITPEATLEVLDRLVPGIPEAMRRETTAATPRAMLSRAVAGIRGATLIVNLPGSPRAVEECLGVLLPVLDHVLETVSGAGGECARHEK